MMLSFICSDRNKIEAELHIYLEEGTYHKRLFRGTITNDMKKEDGARLSWPTAHTTPFFLPPEDPDSAEPPQQLRDQCGVVLKDADDRFQSLDDLLQVI